MSSEDISGRRNSSTQLLEELEVLSQSLYTSTNRRTASLALPRTSLPSIPSSADSHQNLPSQNEDKPLNRPRTRRMSLSPWRSRPKLDDDKPSNQPEVLKNLDHTSSSSSSAEKKGIWNWKPIRALSHIAMQKVSCLFSVEVVTVQGLPASMNGLRLSVCVRKKETKDGAVHTMPSRVTQGAADFEETLFLKCHVYCTPAGNGGGKQLKFEPRTFYVYVFAVDAEELDFGKSLVDLSQLIKESMEKSYEGTRVRQWDVSFKLSGKAKGGEVVLKLGFQIMEKDGGIGIYSQGGEKGKSGTKSSFGRKQSKTSFSVPSPRMQSQKEEAWTPSQSGRASSLVDVQGMDDLNLDEPAPVPSIQKSEEPKVEDLDLPDFDVIDKGVEIQDDQDVESERSVEDRSAASSEVVKEVVHDQVHLARLSELDSIAQQIKALESIMGEEKTIKNDDLDTESQRLDADEETVTREFLSMLEGEETDGYKLNQTEIPTLQLEETDEYNTEVESEVYLSDLGKGLGCVVQTRDGGYLASTNPLDVAVARKDTPKLAVQISKPLVLPSTQSSSGFEIFQRMGAIGVDELSSKLLALMPMDELMGKTAEQIAFEGIANAIIQGRNNKEGASSSAARTIAAVKNMAAAYSSGRKERISTGIWNVTEDPLTIEEILAFSMQKIEAMMIEALKVQAEMPEEEAPFDVSPLNSRDQNQPLDDAIPIEDWTSKHNSRGGPNTVTLTVVVQLRDPLRRYEAVGGPVIAIIHAKGQDDMKGNGSDDDEEEKRFKVTSIDIGGLKVRTGGKRNNWDNGKQRLTAMQWLVAYGLGKAVKKGKNSHSKGPDLLWSISSRVMADMWLKSTRNPDVKFAL